MSETLLYGFIANSGCVHSDETLELIEWWAMSLQSHSQPRAVAALASLYIVRMLGLFMVLPVLTLAGSEYGTDDLALLGIALGVYGLTQACLQIPFGVLSDRFGRKPLIFLGLVIFIVGSVIAATAETVTGLIIGRALQGAGAVAGVVMAMVADLTTDAHRTKAMASIGASIGIAFALSLVVGPWLAALGGIRLIFLVTAALAFIGILILFFAIPRVAAKASLLSLASLKVIVSDTDLLRLNIGVFILHAILTALFIAFPLLLVDAGIAGESHSWVYLLAMTLAFVVMVPLMIMAEKRQQVRLVFTAVLIGLAALMLALAFIPKTALVIVVGMILFFIGFNYLEATLPSLMSKTVPEEYRGAGSGVFSTSQFLGAAVGGMAGGWLLVAGGAVVLFSVAAAAFVFWLSLVRGMVFPVKTMPPKNVVA